MRFMLAALCVASLCLSGCNRQAPAKTPTVSEVQAQIDKVQNDPKIPPNIKPMILGKLQGQLAIAQKQAASSR